MKIYALIGKSGTGKSFHAISLCEEKEIESIIDDGLYIYKGIVCCGKSAKKSETKIGAIKVALFFNEQDKKNAIISIARTKPKSILVIGTSEEMIEKIILRLELLKEDELDKIERIYIENITTEEEREEASIERNVYGKHVVPAPSMQLKKNFAGYFIDPLKLFRGRDVGQAKERTVVRPPFSYKGEYYIDEKAIDDIVRCTSKEVLGIDDIIFIAHTSKPEAYSLDVVLKVKKGYDIMDTCLSFQVKVRDVVEYMTAFNIENININVRSAV